MSESGGCFRPIQRGGIDNHGFDGRRYRFMTQPFQVKQNQAEEWVKLNVVDSTAPLV